MGIAKYLCKKNSWFPHKWLEMFHVIESPAHIKFVWKVRTCSLCGDTRTLRFIKRIDHAVQN